jgi:putative membrane protein
MNNRLLMAALGMAALGGFTLSSGAATAAVSPSAQKFLTDAMQGDASEIKLGQLAQENAGNNGVRDFGKTLVTDHQKAQSQVKQAASSMGVTAADQPTSEAQQEYDKLKTMKGAEFDREFTRYMVQDHQKDIEKFRKEAQANDGAASSLAKEQLPVLQKHLQIAEGLQKQ